MRLIDADALTDRMYHDAFETDTDMQKWDSGCWIRYKMFENAIDNAPTIEPRNIIACEEVDELDMLERMYAEPSGDLISRADTLAKIKEYCIDGDDVVQNWFDTMGIEEVINTMPSVSVDRPQGEDWERYSEKLWKSAYERGKNNRPKGEWVRIWASEHKTCPLSRCSNCNEEYPSVADNYNYCPHCGARMKGGAK